MSANNLLRLVSWNINGIRASIRKKTWPEVKSQLDPDFFGVQEIKATNEFMDTKPAQKEGYTMAYEYATMRKGYSGVASYLKTATFGNLPEQDDNSLLSGETSSSSSPYTITKVVQGLENEKFDEEGRLISHLVTNNSTGKKFVIINGYYPQGGRGPHRVEYKIEFYKEVFEICEQYRKDGYGVMLCGDFNTTVSDIDLARPKENKNVTGCLPEEREALDWFLKGGYVDTFRHFYPDKPDMYSYWDQITRARDRNVGWRIDYWIVSDDLIDSVKDVYIWTDIMGSDHCPVGIDIEL